MGLALLLTCVLLFPLVSAFDQPLGFPGQGPGKCSFTDTMMSRLDVECEGRIQKFCGNGKELERLNKISNKNFSCEDDIYWCFQHRYKLNMCPKLECVGGCGKTQLWENN